jgi:hypothetical protein
MQILTDEYGCCTSGICSFRRECAQHISAGDFRSEDGFAPILHREIDGVYCQTMNEKPLETGGQFPFREEYPANYNSLGRGFQNVDKLMSKEELDSHVRIDGKIVFLPVELSDLRKLLESHKRVIRITDTYDEGNDRTG